MSLSSVCVVRQRPERLNLFKLYDGSKDRKKEVKKQEKFQKKKKENKTMKKKVMKIRRNDVRTLRGESEKGS